MKALVVATLIVAQMMMLSAVADAKTCTTGCPCGNSCISCSETCHKDSGGAIDSETALIIGGVCLGAGLIALVIYLAVESNSASAEIETNREIGSGITVDPVLGFDQIGVSVSF